MERAMRDYLTMMLCALGFFFLGAVGHPMFYLLMLCALGTGAVVMLNAKNESR